MSDKSLVLINTLKREGLDDGSSTMVFSYLFMWNLSVLAAPSSTGHPVYPPDGVLMVHFETGVTVTPMKFNADL